MLQDQVEDGEKLYRCVRRAYAKLENGEWRPSSQAFTDPEYKISVDRAKLCSNDPTYSQMETNDLVCSVVAGEARKINGVIQYDKDVIRQQYQVCVGPDPLPHNAAHALIYAHPQIASKNVFRRLQESLALIAHWEIAPGNTG